jgi:hypothetical protein
MWGSFGSKMNIIEQVETNFFQRAAVNWIAESSSVDLGDKRGGGGHMSGDRRRKEGSDMIYMLIKQQ